MIRLTCIMMIGSALAVSAGLANDQPGAPATMRMRAQAEPKPDASGSAERGRIGEARPRGEPRSPRGWRFDTSDRPDGPNNRKLSAAEQDRALQILGEIDPESAQRLSELRQRDPDAFEKNLPQFGRRLIGLMELEKRQPELFKVRLRELQLEVELPRLRDEILQLRQQGREADANAQVPQLRAKVTEHVECGIRARGWELLLLEEHIKAKRQQLREDTENFPAVVERRMQMLLDPNRPDDPPRYRPGEHPGPDIQTIGSDGPK